ncbi:hypothetical protein J2853_002728 [Streptosporangium lutulentum]|uniref:Uncharacterized protein n=1 Tax=Streptosporangium lutulentum TaxID=1461250 RepID=A0ABT9QA47_9ACTN|nr:hypothetical protein [Streptosporangium lutulentum]MDP9843517.1 hypothetical protein [Streptosporangium lutulentum]
MTAADAAFLPSSMARAGSALAAALSSCSRFGSAYVAELLANQYANHTHRLAAAATDHPRGLSSQAASAAKAKNPSVIIKRQATARLR